MSVNQRLARFSALLDGYPAGFAGNPLNLLMLDDAEIIDNPQQYLRRLDDLPLCDERREYLIDESSVWPFPRIDVAGRPDPWLVSQRLFERFDEAGRILITQGDLAERIDKQVSRQRPTVVALIIVDGLSYYDLAEEDAGEPCFVPGVTTTQYGYRQVVGQPSVSRRLFALGHTQQMGFTYFDPEVNDLSADIHHTFSPSQVTRVREFDHILTHLQETTLSRAYIQITLAGLDQLCHAHYDRPPRELYVKRILSCYEKIIDCLHEKNPHILVVMTADHGILWKDDIEDRLEIVDDLFKEDVRSPRYVKGSVLRPYAHCCRCLGQNYSLLGVPWMTRRFRNNEWGVHGGISAWESLVPFVMYSS